MKIDKSLISGSTTLLILSLLSREEMYGYQMITELARRSDHTFELKEGTLYPILHGLEAERLVTVREKTAETGRSRKYYRITQKGRRALEEGVDIRKLLTLPVRERIGRFKYVPEEESHTEYEEILSQLREEMGTPDEVKNRKEE